MESIRAKYRATKVTTFNEREKKITYFLANSVKKVKKRARYSCFTTQLPPVAPAIMLCCGMCDDENDCIYVTHHADGYAQHKEQCGYKLHIALRACAYINI